MKTKQLMRPSRPRLRIGFVPLLDAAPLIAAHELEYFSHEGLDVRLERQIGWGNVRDKLTFGHLDASHALLGMPLASQLGWQWFAEPLVALVTLGTGGNAITISSRLADLGVKTANGLKQWLGGRREDPPLFAHVLSCSTHHYLLRRWLSEADIDPDSDVRLCVMPPPQMSTQLLQGAIDGFCAGEPWNTLATKTAKGRIIMRTHDLVPDHPEKVLAVSRRWLAQNAGLAARLVRAVLRGCAYCADPARRGDVARLLAGRQYLGLSEELVKASLAFAGDRGATTGPLGYPSATHMAWLLEEMVAAGHAPAGIDVSAVALTCCHAAAYREAAASLGLACPDDDFPPMRLRNGSYDPLARRRSEHEPATARAGMDTP